MSIYLNLFKITVHISVDSTNCGFAEIFVTYFCDSGANYLVGAVFVLFLCEVRGYVLC